MRGFPILILFVMITVTSTTAIQTDYCQSDIDCGENGWCRDNCSYTNVTCFGQCDCEDGYILPNCSYQQKEKWVAFFLSIFLGVTGADRFYLGYIGFGVMKILFFLGAIIFGCIGKYTDSILSIITLCISFILVILLIVFWFIDWISILRNTLPDVNGYSLN